jgi:cation-transporting ATPase 13A1
MLADFAGCYIIEKSCKHFFADLEPKELVTRGRERREERRRLEIEQAENAIEEKKDQ